MLEYTQNSRRRREFCGENTIRRLGRLQGQRLIGLGINIDRGLAGDRDRCLAMLAAGLGSSGSTYRWPHGIVLAVWLGGSSLSRDVVSLALGRVFLFGGGSAGA